MPFWGELLVAAVILVGLVGIVVPILPGTLLIVGALFVWALVVGGWAWSVFALALVVIGVGEVLKYLIAGRSLRADAIPNRTIVVGGLAVVASAPFTIGFLRDYAVLSGSLVAYAVSFLVCYLMSFRSTQEVDFDRIKQVTGDFDDRDLAASADEKHTAAAR